MFVFEEIFFSFFFLGQKGGGGYDADEIASLLLEVEWAMLVKVKETVGDESHYTPTLNPEGPLSAILVLHERVKTADHWWLSIIYM